MPATRSRTKATCSVLPLGDTAVLIELADAVDAEVNTLIHRLSAALRTRHVPWMRDVVPALGSIALHVDPEQLDAVDLVLETRRLVEACLRAPLPDIEHLGRDRDVPVCYDDAFALDLADLCEQTGLERAEVVRRHAASAFRVLMVGFAPGHPYLGGLDPRLSVPRRATPRAAMPTGAIAIANDQCVVYPYSIPGGWSVIGRTPLRVFDARRDPPSLFAPADRVRFTPIERAEYERLARREWPAEVAGAGSMRS